MINKILHYCWFGKKEKSRSVNAMIKSWRKKMPDYEIKEWNETNCDIDSAPSFVKCAYKAEKWAFVSDYFRLKVLLEYGGIYLDTDVEVLKKFDDLLNYDFFIGSEREGYLCTAVIGSSKHNQLIEKFLGIYNNMCFNETPNSKLLYNFLFSNQTIDPLKKIIFDENCCVFPQNYFSPKDYFTKRINITSETYSIHYFDGTWKNKKQKSHDIICRIIYSIIGEKNYNKLKNIRRKK